MKIQYLEDYNALSQTAENLTFKEVGVKRDLLFCAATGLSPTGMYAAMAKNKSHYSQLRVVKLDEWGIIPLSHPDSCESYLKKHLLKPLEISSDRYFGFDTHPDLLESECQKMQDLMLKKGPLDICILGLGKNGHLAFNEPGETLEPDFHKAVLADSTIGNFPAMSQGDEPAYGLSMGMRDILSAKLLILLITGNSKQKAIKALLSGRISTQCPASFLWLHPNAVCLIDQRSLS